MTIPILTIAIPTYNRAHSLIYTLPRLAEDLNGFYTKVKILIIDNCSVDNTNKVVETWISEFGTKLSIKYNRNEVNIGLAKNIVLCFYSADTEYVTFMGDDDCLNKSTLLKLFEVLEGPKVSAVIGTKRSANYPKYRTGLINYEDAVNWFYIYGNGSEGIVNREAGINAIENRGLRAEIESLVWPQTVIGFLAMHDLFPLKVYALDLTLTDSFSDYESVTNKSYWVNSFFSLLRAAVIVDEATGKKKITSALMNSKGSGFYSHIKGILWYGLIADYETSTLEIRNFLKLKFGIRGFFYAAVIKLSDNRIILEKFAALLYLIIQGKGKKVFERRIVELRQEYLLEVERTKENKKRFGNWF
jgi:glycosyltransferase involved in cell wall biosynthesis